VPTTQGALGAVDNRAAVIIMAVTAGSQEIDAGLMGLPIVKVGATGKEVEKVYDSESLGMDSLSTILPGETQTIKIGYGMTAAQAKDVRVEVGGPSYEDRPAIFKGAIG